MGAASVGTDPGIAGIFSVFASLAVILLLLAGAAYLARRFRNGAWLARPQMPARIEIIGARQIGWQCSLMIVEAEGRRFLIGAGRNGLTSIGALDAQAGAQQIETRA
jgi:flagellar biogenesis protein FliO